MKRLFFILMMTLMMSSCVSSYGFTSASQNYDGYRIEYSYEYYYNGIYCPVIYVSNIPYYYYRNVWYIVPSYRYTHIHHRHRPVYRHFYSKPPHKPNNHYHPNNRPQHRPNGNVNQRPHNPHHKPAVRPNNGQHRPQGRPTHYNGNTHRSGHNHSRNNRR